MTDIIEFEHRDFWAREGFLISTKNRNGFYTGKVAGELRMVHMLDIPINYNNSIMNTIAINAMKSFAALLLFLQTITVVTCFVIPAVPYLLAQTSSPPSPSNRNTCLSSQSEDTATNTMKWFQYEISITAPSRGCHLITSDVEKTISKDLSDIKIGMCNLFVQHTSASLTINENADPDVRRDLETALNKIVPASWNHDGTFRHTMEGDDDMPVS